MTPHVHHMLHILQLLLTDYRSIHSTVALYPAYVRDHALFFLHSGWTSRSGGPRYLHWLTAHHVSPIDW